jgi:L-ascorbate metabolism protein UlaG (beta-lactamase superfamily)
MNSVQGARLATALDATHVVPVHYDSFSHLAEPGPEPGPRRRVG